MLRALCIKELREIWWLGLLPLAFMLYAVSDESSLSPWLLVVSRSLDRWEKIPFGDSLFALAALQWGCLLAAALGLWQSFRESHSRTWHFLLHRPVDRQVILTAKLFSAAVVYLLAIVLPVLGLAVWAAIPGTHASPFDWSLTASAWYAVSVGTAVYLSGMFAGLRRGRMIGTRWWPLVATSIVVGATALSFLAPATVWIWGLLLFWDTLLIAAVRAELNSADFN
ncbi:MAG: family transporter protein [Planctomycetaceae bacterium]|nr:family transporter protein [Planctomycetaceae bacterium]